MRPKTPVPARDATRRAATAQLTPIGEVCRSHEITPRSLRFYEQRHLLSSIRVGGTRYYDRPQVNRLEKILKGKHLGFTLTEIGELLEAAPGDKEAGFPLADEDLARKQLQYLQKRRDEIDEAIAELRQSIHKPAESALAGRKRRRSHA